MKFNLSSVLNKHEFIFNIVDNDENLGSIELALDNDNEIVTISNVRKSDSCKRKRILEQVIPYLVNLYNYDIVCIPLQHLVKYYESLGFVKFKQTKDLDVYYILKVNSKSS